MSWQASWVGIDEVACVSAVSRLLHLHCVAGVLVQHRQEILKKRDSFEEMLRMFNELPSIVTDNSLIQGARLVLRRQERKSVDLRTGGSMSPSPFVGQVET